MRGIREGILRSYLKNPEPWRELMNLSDFFRKAALLVPFLGVVLVAYPAARPTANDTVSCGVQVAAQGTTKHAVASARYHEFDKAVDGSVVFPELARQSSEISRSSTSREPNGYRSPVNRK
jgi:hypothetical protein